MLYYWKKMLFNKIFEKYMFYNQIDKVIICMNDLDECCKKKERREKNVREIDELEVVPILQNHRLVQARHPLHHNYSYLN